MKIIVFLLLLACPQLSARCYAQRIRIDVHKQSLEKVFEAIHQQTGYTAIGESGIFKHAKPLTLQLLDVTLTDALDTIMKLEGCYYEFLDSVIKINAAPAKPGNEQQPEDIDVTGTVLADTGEPLVRATISMKNGRGLVITDGAGRFEVKVTAGMVLVASYTGCTSREFVAGKSSVQLSLARTDSPLDKAQIIAYGTTTERLRTGDVTTVNANELEKQTLTNPLLGLEGRVPGVYISSFSGLPGSGVTIRIQGQNSIANGNDPLILVDGVPYPSQTLSSSIGTILGSSGQGSSSTGNPLHFFNPADIESITILKDADATAIYGSKGANGVILITTKKGVAGNTKFTVHAQEGVGGVPEKLRLMSGQQYLQMRHEALMNDGITQPGSFDYDINGVWDTTRRTDWQKSLIGGTADYTSIDAAISGGNANTCFLLRGSYYRQTEVFPGSFFDTHGSLFVSLNHSSANHRFTLQANLSGLYDVNKLPGEDLTRPALLLAPDAPALYQSNGVLNWQLSPLGAATWSNPLGDLYKPYNESGKSEWANLALGYKILNGLDLRVNGGWSGFSTSELSRTMAVSLAPNVAQAKGNSARNSDFAFNTISTWLIEPQVNYMQPIGSGKINMVAGATMQEQTSSGIAYNGFNFSSDALLEDMAAAGSLTVSSNVHDVYRYSGFFARLSYNYLNQYLLDLTVMRDGSSRFGPDSRFRNFAAAGVGWVFTEQKLVHDLLPMLGFGKIRLSYGSTGNDQIGDYRYLPLYSAVNAGVPFQGVNAMAPTNLPNPDLQWETTTKLQVGMDLRLLKDRVLLTASYSRNTSSNQLLNTEVPQLTGGQIFSENLPATVRNTDLEFELQATLLQLKKVKWSVACNLTLPKNELVRYAGAGPLPANLVVGASLGVTPVFVARGVDPMKGLYQFRDSHGNLTTTPSTATDLLGLTNTNFAKYYGGLENTVSYGNIEMSFFFQIASLVASNVTAGFAPGPGFTQINQPQTVLGRWQQRGDVTSTERYGTGVATFYFNEQSSTAAYSVASYWRLNNVSLSWRLIALMRRLRLKELRCFVHGQNLVTLTKFPGLDPQTGNFVLPPLRVITGGVEFSI